MWRPDQRLEGPFPIAERDLPGINRVFSDAFTDRYRRDGLVGVRVPPLNRAIWRFALRCAGDGAMLWRDGDGGIAAFNLARRAGAEGWMGPLAVRPERQGLGLGRTIVDTGIAWLVDGGARIIGLETMPRTVDNIGFYARLGFLPGHLTMTLTRDVTGRGRRAPGFRLLGHANEDAWRARAVARMARASGGRDYTRECAATAELALGDLCVVADGDEVRAAALWHSVPLTEGRRPDELRVLKLYAGDGAAFDAVLGTVEGAAAALGLKRVSVRCQTTYRDALRRLVARGYAVRWTDLRMSLVDYPEPALAGDAVLFSNWEI